MANIKQRAGAIHIRVGGNTQETATLVDSLPNNKMMAKDTGSTSNPVSFFLTILCYHRFLIRCVIDQNTRFVVHSRVDIYDGEYISAC